MSAANWLGLAFLASVLAASVFVGITAVRWIQRNITSSVLRLVSICLTLALLLFGQWVAWIVLYFATGGH